MAFSEHFLLEKESPGQVAVQALSGDGCLGNQDRMNFRD